MVGGQRTARPTDPDRLRAGGYSCETRYTNLRGKSTALRNKRR
jgi:ribosomal protein L15E